MNFPMHVPVQVHVQGQEICVPLRGFVLIPNIKWCPSFYSMMKADFCQLFKLQNLER